MDTGYKPEGTRDNHGEIVAAVIALAAVLQLEGVGVEMFAGWKPDRTG